VSLKEALEANRNNPTEITILNYKTKKTRKITVCPCDDWGGVGMLGLMIANDSFDTADERVVRVLCVFSQSPAETAGLHPFVDYILGTERCIFQGLDAFEDFVMRHLDQEIRLRVYNSNICQVREVIITPTENWSESNDQGVLGCEVSSGILHKIPDVLQETIITAHESTFSEFVNLDAGVEAAQRRQDNQDGVVVSTDVSISLDAGRKTAQVPSEKPDVLVPNDLIKCSAVEGLKSTEIICLSDALKQTDAASVQGAVEGTDTLVTQKSEPVMDGESVNVQEHAVCEVGGSLSVDENVHPV